MSEHTAKIDWTRTTKDFVYDTFSREHTWEFDSGVSLAASSAPGYQGHPNLVDPEEAFVAALASCHMLTFLALAARKRMVVNRYSDAPVGFLEKNAEGTVAVTRVVLRPKAQFEDPQPSKEALEKLHEQAHRHCFISNSVRSEVTIEPA